MLIEREGHSYGSDFADLATFVREFGSPTDSADEVRQSRCAICDCATFWMEVSEEAGVAKRTCTACKQAAFIGDSEAHWAKADAGDAACPCGTKVFEVAVGFCLTKNRDVDWMAVGARCVACDLVGIYADWCIEFTPSSALIDST